jgi:membrane-associated protein
MPYGRYFAYDVAGGILWGGGMVLGGYFLGRQIPNISENIHYVIAVVIFLSLLPPIISFLRAKSSGSPEPPPAPEPASRERD